MAAKSIHWNESKLILTIDEALIVKLQITFSVYVAIQIFGSWIILKGMVLLILAACQQKQAHLRHHSALVTVKALVIYLKPKWLI